MTTATPPLDPDGVVARELLPTVPPGWPHDGLGSVRAIAEQLPQPESLPPGSWLSVAPGPVARRRLLGRLLRRGAATRVHLAVRCTALLARGYVDVCAAEEVAFGRSPR